MLRDDYAQAIKKAYDRSPYGQWLANEGVATIEGFAVDDIWTVDLAPWPRIGGNAVFLNLYAFMEGLHGVYVVEIPAGGALSPERHVYEKFIVVLEGRGATEIWQEGDTAKHVFEWGRGSLFSPPINTWHRLFNLGTEPVRLLVTTDAPRMINGFRDLDFIFNCPFPFRSRYDGQQAFFTPSEHLIGDGLTEWKTNFIHNILEEDLDDGERKASGNRMTAFDMSGNNGVGHIAQWPVGRYHTAHYHRAGALLMGLRSEGYVLLWSKDLGIHPYEAGHGDDVVQFLWKKGSVYSPPDGWFHQHFNTGHEQARHIAFRGRGGTGFDELHPMFDARGLRNMMVNTNEGGTLIEYADEDPEIRRRYEEELTAKGVTFAMPESIYQPGGGQRLRTFSGAV